MGTEGEEKNIHAGHRKRVRETIAKQGIEGMPQHNVLEFLLFHTIPRQDVNVLSHQLIERFNSISGVLGAGYEELTAVKGVNEATALFLHVFPEICRFYLKDKGGDGRKRFKNLGDLRDYVAERLMFRNDETLLLGCLNAKNELLDLRVVATGGPTGVNLPVRDIVEIILNIKATAVIIAHNHPGGLALPSSEDVESTRFLCQYLAPLEVKLLDHIIIADDCDYVSMRDSGLFVGM